MVNVLRTALVLHGSIVENDEMAFEEYSSSFGSIC
jgi:hypothetical protein